MKGRIHLHYTPAYNTLDSKLWTPKQSFTNKISCILKQPKKHCFCFDIIYRQFSTELFLLFLLVEEARSFKFFWLLHSCLVNDLVWCSFTMKYSFFLPKVLSAIILISICIHSLSLIYNVQSLISTYVPLYLDNKFF